MEKENLRRFTYLDQSFDNIKNISDSSVSVFSECNSDRSGEFSSHSSEDRRFFACPSGNLDELINQLVSDLQSCSIEVQGQAAKEIRLLAKHNQEHRIKIANSGAIRPLVSLMFSQDSQLQEQGATAILNLSLCDENKGLIARSGAIRGLVRVLKTGTPVAKENSACALVRLAQNEENSMVIGRSGAIPLLIDLLENGSVRGKKDASTTLFTLCSMKENKIRAIQNGIMKPLVELMADFELGLVDKASFVMNRLVSLTEGKTALVVEGGIPVLVEIVDVGSKRQKEIAADILLQLCEDSLAYRLMVSREGALPSLIALTQSGTTKSIQKAEALIDLLRQPRRQ